MTKKIIILGAQGNLGQAVIKQTLQETDLSIYAVDQYKPTNKFNSKINYLQTDFSAEDQVAKLLNKLADLIDGDSILISTLGKFGLDYANEELDFSHMQQSIQINLLGVSQLCLGLSNICITNKAKLRIVIVGSTAACVGSRDIGYGIAKAGLNGLVLSLSKCYAHNSITAIGINPGVFSSPMSAAVDTKRTKEVINATHLKRAGEAEEIANLVTYAALNAPDFLTGSLINVNGGQYS